MMTVYEFVANGTHRKTEITPLVDFPGDEYRFGSMLRTNSVSRCTMKIVQVPYIGYYYYFNYYDRIRI